jgi:hypothetical protein
MGVFFIGMINLSIEAAQCRFEPQFAGGYIRRLTLSQANKDDEAILLRSHSGRKILLPSAPNKIKRFPLRENALL